MKITDIEAAAARLTGRVVHTPVLRWPELDAALGAQIFIKAEPLQLTGAFKIRGALNKVLGVPPESVRNGLVAASSGNHGQAVALVAQMLAIPAILVLPRDAPAIKIDAVRRRGASIVHYNPACDDRDAITAEVAAAHRMLIVPSSDDPDTAAGHGTAALEMLGDTGPLDVLAVPVGGGGLAAGCATVAKSVSPGIEVVGVEPFDGDDTARSVIAGRRVRVPPPNTIADGLRHQTPGKFTFELNRRLIDRFELVTDGQIAEAMRLLWQVGGLMAEPSGACALAGLLGPRQDLAGKRVGVVISGGNISTDLFHKITATEAQPKYAGAR